MFNRPSFRNETPSGLKEIAKRAALVFMLGTPGCQSIVDGIKKRAQEERIQEAAERHAQILETTAQRGTPVA